MNKRIFALVMAMLTMLCALPMLASAEERPTLTILMTGDSYVED